MVDEDRYLAQEQVEARADLLVDGTGLTPPRLRTSS
jgi:hypothetical protein